MLVCRGLLLIYRPRRDGRLSWYGCDAAAPYGLCVSRRFVKSEQLERWRAKRKLVSGSKHRGRTLLWRFGGITPGQIFRLSIKNPAMYRILGRKMVRNAIQNAF